MCEAKKRSLKELLKRRKKRMINSFTRRFGKHLIKILPKLPQNYEFIFSSYTVSGQFAFARFLTFCGLNQARLAKDDEIFYGDAIGGLENSKTKNFVSINCYKGFKNRLNYANLLSNDVPIVITLRDPISRIRSAVNKSIKFDYFINRGKKNRYSLNDNISEALGEISYGFLFGKAINPAKTPQVALYIEAFLDSVSFNYKSNLAPYLAGGEGIPSSYLCRYE